MTGPRPIQQLISTIQMGEQLRRQKEEQDRLQRSTTTGIVDQFMRIAPSQVPEDRAALATLLAGPARVDPGSLTAAVASRPVSAATTGDKAAAAQFGTMESMYPRIREQIEQIPDENTRDIALNAVAQQFSGMPVGTARQQSATADRATTPNEVMKNGIFRSLGEMMSVPELAKFDQDKERITQTWTQLADNKTAEAMRLAIMQGELQARMMQMRMSAEGKEGKTLNPVEQMQTLFDMTQKVSEKPLTKEARAQMAWPIRAQFEVVLQSLGGRDFLKQTNPELLNKLDETYSNERLLNTSGNFWTQFRK